MVAATAELGVQGVGWVIYSASAVTGAMFQWKGKWQMLRESPSLCVSLSAKPTGLSIPILMNAQKGKLEGKVDEGKKMEVMHGAWEMRGEQAKIGKRQVHFGWVFFSAGCKISTENRWDCCNYKANWVHQWIFQWQTVQKHLVLEIVSFNIINTWQVISQAARWYSG